MKAARVALIAFLGLVATGAAILRPGFRMIAIAGGTFGELPGVGFQTHDLCFSGRVSYRYLEVRGLFSFMIQVIAAPANRVSARVAELRGASACPAGVWVEKAWGDLLEIRVPGDRGGEGLQRFEFARGTDDGKARLKLLFSSEPSMETFKTVCRALAQSGFPAKFPIDLRVGADLRVTTCDEESRRRPQNDAK